MEELEAIAPLTTRSFSQHNLTIKVTTNPYTLFFLNEIKPFWPFEMPTL